MPVDGPADGVAELERRVRLLEAEIQARGRRGRVTALTLLATLALAALGVAKAQEATPREVVEAQEFIIRNEAGQVLFYVGQEQGGAVLLLRDAAGRVTARLPPRTEMVPLTNR